MGWCLKLTGAVIVIQGPTEGRNPESSGEFCICFWIPDRRQRVRASHGVGGVRNDIEKAYTEKALFFSGTITFVELPFIAATNLSAFGSIIGKLP